MNLKVLRAKAEIAEKESFNEYYEFSDEVSPTLILLLLDDREKLRSAIRHAISRIVPRTPAAVVLTEALTESDETFPD